jgi:hypothetical protein
MKASPPSDPQQHELYTMEREEIGSLDYSRLTFTKAKQIARAVCRRYRIPAAKMRMKPVSYAAIWEDGRITLSSIKGTGLDLLTVLHELAHHLHWHLGGIVTDKQENHGPEFMACYMSILDTVRVIPADAMEVICKRRGIRYILPGPTRSSLKLAIKTTPVLPPAAVSILRKVLR